MPQAARLLKVTQLAGSIALKQLEARLTRSRAGPHRDLRAADRHRLAQPGAALSPPMVPPHAKAYSHEIAEAGRKHRRSHAIQRPLGTRQRQTGRTSAAACRSCATAPMVFMRSLAPRSRCCSKSAKNTTHRLARFRSLSIACAAKRRTEAGEHLPVWRYSPTDLVRCGDRSEIEIAAVTRRR